ncbi:GntR family transcriptional regulator / MocR family aminotransferase [Evansella caseinilytica]|uniref:GntR family transcriptional regulator / MocR family aminotransferase n=1 Tax=Evansella caseinilytica TaxID=1503961 RepID=A0A1H3R098_9BACI|nr:PLP-dependent aminotransferase family protein [Evansella caseinilytica]SDZ18933.1 GntR family transcriptional regulator / MocR family aminotransferase [Evansella caseinilytica]
MLWVPLDRKREISLTSQVYVQLRTQILRGELSAGEKLPSTRGLAAELQVSRNVILEAYEQLTAEGYITSRPGAGSYVAEGAFLEQADCIKTDLFYEEKNSEGNTQHVIDFRSGIPDLTLFPKKIWARLAYDVCCDSSPSVFSYGNPEGRPELRHVLSRYLVKTRGVHCRPDQLVITSGATQALTLAARLLLTAGNSVWMEDPITNDIQTIFTSTGAVIHPVPVDEDGLQTSLITPDLNPQCIFVTPSHQFPLGSTLPIQRRIQLIKFARETGCFIVEDDYDSEFRYEGPPVHSLQGLDPDRVIYVGSFSKILSPALRMGYLILPPRLIEQCRKLKWFSDLHTPSLEQIILKRFIEEGYLERHILKMKKLYKKRRDHLISMLTGYFSGKVRISGHTTGLHLIAEFPDMVFTEQLLTKIVHAGVRVYPVEHHAVQKGIHQRKVIIGYGHLQEEEIEEGIKILFECLSSE